MPKYIANISIVKLLEAMEIGREYLYASKLYTDIYIRTIDIG